jgi:hypothetical protein
LRLIDPANYLKKSSPLAPSLKNKGVHKNQRMKKLILCGVLFLLSVALNNAKSQVNVRINIGSQPAWGPAGYDYVEYYYLPDIETYYYVPTGKFVYLSNNKWVFSRSIPARYKSYDVYSGYKVVVNEPNAYKHFKTHKDKYAGYRGNRSQIIIRNSDEPKYYVVKGHPKYKGNSRKAKNKGRGR